MTDRAAAPVPYVTVADVARAVGVSTGTVRAWIRAGRLRAWRTPGGRIRLRPEDVTRALHRDPAPQVEAAQ